MRYMGLRKRSSLNLTAGYSINGRNLRIHIHILSLMTTLITLMIGYHSPYLAFYIEHTWPESIGYNSLFLLFAFANSRENATSRSIQITCVTSGIFFHGGSTEPRWKIGEETIEGIGWSVGLCLARTTATNS